jgi:HD superfamily phosphohydrolase
VTGCLPPGAEGFRDRGVDWTPLLRALVSGELDADRMDYLLRDSFHTGVNCGRYDAEWIVHNLSAAQRDGRAVLALKGSAIFAFEDFLLSRYHMFLSVYLHHTSVAYDFMLRRYYEESEGEFEIPFQAEPFLGCDDVALLQVLRASKNRWAARIVGRRGFKRVAQFTERDEGFDLRALGQALSFAGVEHFEVESMGVFSNYTRGEERDSLYVVDAHTGRLTEITRYTPLYQRFQGPVRLSRVYARPDQAEVARAVVGRMTGRVDLEHE